MKQWLRTGDAIRDKKTGKTGVVQNFTGDCEQRRLWVLWDDGTPCSMIDITRVDYGRWSKWYGGRTCQG